MRVRLLAVITALVLSLLGAVPASADGGGGDGNNDDGGYLALGDSVPFGFSPLLDAHNAANFVGYPEIVAKGLGIDDVNATCPGEATGGFLSLTGTDNLCRPYRSAFPLHVSYKTTQMEFALKYLHRHRDTKLVTLTLGANDIFRFQKDCAAGATVGTCPLGLGGVLATMQANLNTILSGIWHAGYRGTIVALTYYALTYDAAGIAGTTSLAGPMIAAAAANHALVASGLEAWRATATAAPFNGSSCAAGLLIATPLDPSSPCNVHPTPKGRDLLAGAVLQAIAASCTAHSARRCLKLGGGDD
jgi:lysophospholipase L1-like esterase